MNMGKKKRGFALVIVAVVTGLMAALLTPATGGASLPRAVTVDKTIKVAGLGLARTYANDAPVGAQARFQRANETNEVKGYKFEFAGFADDNNDPSTALSEARRLVTQEGAVAIVPDVSTVLPIDYLTQQQIPAFGPGYSSAYCPDGSNGWAFGVYGCIIRDDPTQVPNSQWQLLKKQLDAKGIKNPTAALIGTDLNSGKVSVAGSASAAQAAGFKVVYAKGAFPAPPAVVGDYSPFAQALLTSNGDKQPDVVYSSVPAANSLPIFNLMKTSGYTGTILSPYYSSILLQALKDSYVFVQFAGFEANSKGIKQMDTDVQAFKPGASKTIGLAGAYFGADMFIQAIKLALKTNKTLTTAAIQKAASGMTYQIKDTVGPTIYPKSYQISNQSCATLLLDDGTAFSIVQPFTCTNKYVKIDKKFSGGYPS